MSDPSVSVRLRPLAERVIGTLRDERDALSGVRDLLQSMTEALRSADHDALTEGAIAMGAAVRSARTLRDARDRQAALLGRATATENASLVDVADLLHRTEGLETAAADLDTERLAIADVRDASEQLAASFRTALEAANRVNRDLVNMVHGLMQPSSAVYRSNGTKAQAAQSRSMINQVG